MNLQVIFLACAALFSLAAPLTAQSPGAGRAAGIIGKLDTVEIRVFREDELTTAGQLSADGSTDTRGVTALRPAGA